MKKLFMTCGLLLVITMCATSVMAQNAPTAPPPAPGQGPGGPARQMLTPEQRADKQTEMMQKNLGLSSDQVTKVKQINLTYWTQVDQLTGNNASASADHQGMRTQMNTLRDKRDADLKGVLTSDQYAKMQVQMQNRGPQQRPGMPPPAPAPQQPNQH